MKTLTVRNQERPVKETEWGSLQWMVDENAEWAGMTLGRVTFKEGQANPPHKHPTCDEILFVISGTLEHSKPEGGTVELNPGDCIVLPRDKPHWAKNIGTGEAVVLVAFNSANRTVVGE